MYAITLGGSIVAYKIEKDGRIGKKLFYKKFKNNSKIHQIYFSKNYNELYVINIGLNQLIKYDIVYDEDKLKLARKDIFYFEKDTKPRHMVIDKQDNIYVVTEDSCELYKIKCDNEDKFKLVEKIAILKKEKDYTGCAIKIDSQSKYIYISIRGKNIIVVFNIEDNRLNMIQSIDCNGKCPRDITLDSKNKYLFCANQKSNDISVFEIKNGKLKLLEDKYDVYNPTCIVVD